MIVLCPFLRWLLRCRKKHLFFCAEEQKVFSRSCGLQELSQYSDCALSRSVWLLQTNGQVSVDWAFSCLCGLEVWLVPSLKRCWSVRRFMGHVGCLQEAILALLSCKDIETHEKITKSSELGVTIQLEHHQAWWLSWKSVMDSNDYSSLNPKFARPAFQLPMFAKCHALPKKDLVDMFVSGIHSSHSFWDFQASNPYQKLEVAESSSTFHHLSIILWLHYADPFLAAAEKRLVSCREAESFLTELWSPRFVTIQWLCSQSFCVTPANQWTFVETEFSATVG